MAWFIIPLYALTIPYIGLIVMVLVGMFKARQRPFSKETPSVSVVIPSHNEEKDLPATLESLSKQKYEGNLEFVIVNDRSEDKTEEIIKSFVNKDNRFKLVNVTKPSKRLAPKVNAVNTGIQNSKGEIILTSDSDCQYSEHWVTEMVSHFESDVSMVVGYIVAAPKKNNFVEKFEITDWFSLMLVSRSLTHFGWKFASSANNQGYRRSAFEAIGGFGSIGRAPSGDEDLLTQRIGKLPNMRIVFASTPNTRVRTQSMPDLRTFLKQRRRWVSRYHHTIHYRPAFIASIACLGFQSVLLAIGILLTPFFPKLAPWVFDIWVIQLFVQLLTMYIGTGQLERRDLWGFNALRWAILHPFFIAFIVVRSFFQPGDWKAGARSYRRRLYKRKVREIKRKVTTLYEGLP